MGKFCGWVFQDLQIRVKRTLISRIPKNCKIVKLKVIITHYLEIGQSQTSLIFSIFSNFWILRIFIFYLVSWNFNFSWFFFNALSRKLLLMLKWRRLSVFHSTVPVSQIYFVRPRFFFFLKSECWDWTPENEILIF